MTQVKMNRRFRIESRLPDGTLEFSQDFTGLWGEAERALDEYQRIATKQGLKRDMKLVHEGLL